MQKNLAKYFWDGQTNISGTYKLRRILEYASFPDMISYPFEDVKKYLPFIKIEKLRTSSKRIDFLKAIKPNIPQSKTWDEAIEKIIKI